MSSFHVPTVDIAPYVAHDRSPASRQARCPDGPDATERRAEVAAAMDRACREVGFVQIVGHGVPDHVVEGLAAAMDAFFDQDLATKEQSIRPPAENRGYTAPKSESLSLSAGVEAASRMNDFFEAFNVGASTADYAADPVPPALTGHYAATTWPSMPDHPGFRAAVETYFAEAHRVARTLTRVFEDALALPTGFFDAITRHPINVLRMNNYALPAGTEVDLDGDLTGMGEHTDYGIVTVLWADAERGLQVLDGDGAWHDVLPRPGALLVNLGDLTTRLTNEQWLSTLHRVKPPVVDGTIRRRRSAAFFHDGDAEAAVGPLPAFTTVDPPVYRPVTVDEHVRAKLAGSRAGVLNDAAEREVVRLRGSA